jgi:hypothetical protein
MIVPRSVLRRKRDVSGESCRENQKEHFMSNNIFISPRKSFCLRDYDDRYDAARHATAGNIIWRMRFACPIIKATHTHTHTHSLSLSVSLSLIICNTYCFPKATVVMRTGLIATL